MCLHSPSILYVTFTGLAVRATEAGLAVRARRRLVADERGQASAEYALVLLGAAAVAILVMAWATQTDAVKNLLDVMKAVTDRVT